MCNSRRAVSATRPRSDVVSTRISCSSIVSTPKRYSLQPLRLCFRRTQLRRRLNHRRQLQVRLLHALHACAQPAAENASTLAISTPGSRLTA